MRRIQLELRACKDKLAEIPQDFFDNLIDAQGVLRLWRHHFSTLLRGDGDINVATREGSEPAPMDEVEIPPPSHNEI